MTQTLFDKPYDETPRFIFSAAIVPIVAQRDPAELAALVCALMDLRALEQWADDLRDNPEAPAPESAFGVAKRGW